MQLSFSKYHGSGNDFILVDNTRGEIWLSVDQIQKLCDRHFGIGSDGLMLLEQRAGVDYYVNFYNPDGSQSFCGNGSRCAFHFANALGLVSDRASFGAIDGEHTAEFVGDQVRISMRNAAMGSELGEDLLFDTGSPHFIRKVDDLNSFDLVAEGRNIRYGEMFKEEGVNVNWISQSENGIALRTYERGVEDETLSCGTGVTAAALAANQLWNLQSPVAVAARGGHLSVEFEKTEFGYQKVYLTGLAQEVFKGEIQI